MTAGVTHNLDAFDEVKQLRAEIERLRALRLVLLGGSAAVTGALATFQPC